MDPIRRNRFKIEEDWNNSQPSYYKEDPYLRRLDERDRESTYESTTETNRPILNFLFWATLIILVCAVCSAAVYYFYYYKKTNPESIANQLNDPKIDKRSLELLIDKAYLPKDSIRPGLANCLNSYYDRYVNKAFRVCEEFLNTPESDEDKSIALTVLGVMFDEAGRYPSAIERLEKAVQYDQKNYFAYYNLALAFKHSGKFEEARKAAAKAKEIAPNDARIALLTGNLYQEIGDPTAAIQAYREGQSLAPSDPVLTYNLAISYYKQGKIPEAIEEFQKVGQLSPNSHAAALSYGHLGSIFYGREDYDRADYYFREAVRLKPSDAKSYYNLGLIQLKKKNPEEAARYFQKALDTGAQDAEVYRYIAEAFVTMGQPSMAIQALKKGLLLKPSDVDTMFALSELYYKKGELIEAESLYRRIIRLTPGDSYTETAYVNLGIILDEMERFQDSIQAFEAVIALNPKSLSARYNAGLAYLHAGMPTKAIENFRKAQAIDASHIPSRIAIADYYAENRFYREAIAEYEEILHEKEDLSEARLKLADVYLNVKSYDAAEKHLLYLLNHAKEGAEIKQAHRKLALVYANSGASDSRVKAKEEAFRASHMDPGDMESKLVLAKILIDSGSLLDREKAIEELILITRSDAGPTVLAKAHNYLGVCYFKNGEFKRAIAEFQSAMDMNPSLTEAYENKRAARAQYEKSLENKKRDFF
ncbi:putative TPR-repeat-containing protein [Leptospira ryugenii]|uniref:Putative TPR-repeat-containing protein n=1 Tax=Leptospira ryugenii TaxID=1917863 RepID=A0A2P2DYB4_9LEPT|nr:tetratricopeptide repeat protein [Leptospira ryugenii]GBF49635.1 putative TPR-repeat-containing protein [Leptospira ryugenii]